MNPEALEDRLDAERAAGWRPSAGAKIVGTIVGEDEGRDYKGDPYPIVTVRTSSGEEVAVHAFHDVLKNELARLRPAIGDEIGVRYIGKDEEKGYHRYRVVGGGGDGIDWTRYSDSNDAPAAPEQTRVHAPLEPAPPERERTTRREDDDIPF